MNHGSGNVRLIRLAQRSPFEECSGGAGRSANSGADFLRLADAITALSTARGIDEIIAIVRGSARALSGAEGIAVIFEDHGFCHYVVEDAESPLWAGERFPASSCVSGWAMMHNETVIIPDVFLDPRVPLDAYRRTFVRSLIMTPVGEDKPFAAIGAYWGHSREAQPDEIAVLQALARSTATAFKNVQLYDELKREAARSEALYLQAEEQLAQKVKAERHLRLLVNELNHRVKNSLFTVQALAAETLKGGEAVETACKAFFVRLQGLSLIHEILTEANWESADLRLIARRILEPYGGGGHDRFSVTGPEVRLSPKAASSLSMALNELAANAVRHGALSVPGGRVALHWSVVDGPDGTGPELRLTWRESGAVLVEPPTHSGFGERLLKRALPFDLNGQVMLDYRPEGAVFEIRAPFSAVSPQPCDPAFAHEH